MPTLLDKFRSQLIDQLQYRSIRTCTEWAKRFRVMGNPFPGPFTIDHHPWTAEMMDWDGDWVGPKSSQMAYTESALNRCFFNIDIKKVDVIYLLPKADPDASDFSAARFTPALELSPHLKELFTEANNVGYKRAGAVSLYVRGMQSRSGVKSLPAGMMVFDELDEMPKENVELASHRTSGQQSSQTIKISTPTVPGMGIDLAYQSTTKEHYYFKCPHCSRTTEFTFPECIVITATTVNDPKIKDSHYICKECKTKLEHDDKINFLNPKNGAGWSKTENYDAEVRGFHINRMYSMAKSGKPENFAAEKIKADNDLTCKQEFYNSVLGMAYVIEGARINLEQILKLLRSHSRLDAPPPVRGFRTLGIDVGTWLHWEVNEYHLTEGLTTDINALSTCMQVSHGKVAHFEELDQIMRDYQILTAVIDANPERRKAREFASRFPGHVYMCFYGNSLKGNEVNLNKEASTITVDRTSWMDLSLGRMNSSRIALPRDVDEEYKKHITNCVRRYVRDSNGNPVGKWITVEGEADHYAHARTYAEIALPIAMTLTTNRDISSFL